MFLQYFLDKHLIADLAFDRSLPLQNLFDLSLYFAFLVFPINPILSGKIEDLYSIAVDPIIPQFLNLLKDLTTLIILATFFRLLGVGANLERLVGQAAQQTSIVLLLLFLDLKYRSFIDPDDADL